MKNQWGTPVMSLSEVVKNFSMEQGNNNRHHYLDNLVRAQRVFEDLLKDTLFSIKYKVIDVDKSDNTICMPQDITRLLSINVVDHCGQIVPLGHNPDMNTLKLMAPAKTCSCKACGGKGTLCDAIDAIQVINETVLINGYEFNKRTWIQKDGNGVIKKVMEIPYPDLPYPDGVAPTVSIITEEETLCTLEVTPSSCIKSTPANHQKLLTHCGCYIPAWQGEIVNYFCGIGPQSPAMNLRDINVAGIDGKWIRDYYCENNYWPRSNYGYWNWEANAREKIHMKMIRTDKVIICYQTNGQDCSGDEILVPKYALDAMQFGITYRQRAWSPIYSLRDKESSRIDYEREKEELRTFLNPVSLDALCDLQMVIPKW